MEWLIGIFIITIIIYIVYLLYRSRYFKTLDMYSCISTNIKSNDIISKVLKKRSKKKINVIKSPSEKNGYDNSRKIIMLNSSNYETNNIKSNFVALHESSHFFQWEEKGFKILIQKIFRWPLLILGTFVNFYLFLYVFCTVFFAIPFFNINFVLIVSLVFVFSSYLAFILYAVNDYFLEKNANKRIFEYVDEYFEYSDIEKESLEKISKMNNIYNSLKCILPLMAFFQLIFMFVWIILSFLFNLIKILLPRRRRY